MKITILTDSPNSWILPYVDDLKKDLNQTHSVTHIYSTSDIIGGDIMFILSCEKILKSEHLKLHKSNVVVHESKVPLGKGWSPLTWQILEGSNNIPVSLFEAVETVDAAANDDGDEVDDAADNPTDDDDGYWEDDDSDDSDDSDDEEIDDEENWPWED